MPGSGIRDPEALSPGPIWVYTTLPDYADTISRRSIRSRRPSRWSCARCRFPRSITTRCCSPSAPSRCADPTCTSRATRNPGRSNVPVMLGHEFGGTVAGVGRRCAASARGTASSARRRRVICGECLMCRSGRYNLCPSRKGFGYGIDGAMAQYVRVPARCLHRIPDALPFEHRVPGRAARGGLQRDVRELDVGPATRWSCSGRDRSACCARAWRRSRGANPLIVAGLPERRARGSSRGAAARRHPHRQRPDRGSRRPSSVR